MTTVTQKGSSPKLSADAREHRKMCERNTQTHLPAV